MVRSRAGWAGVILVLCVWGHPGRCGAQEPPGDTPAPACQGPFGSASSAWFAGVEVGIFVPVTPVGTAVTGANVTLPPGVEAGARFGYRFDDGSALAVGYRNLSASGTDKSVSPDSSPVPPHVLFEVNSLDLDYLSPEAPGLLGDRVRWEAGVRVASKLLESRGSDSYSEQSSHTLFTGAGPHLGLTDSLRLGRSGFGLFSHVELALLFGGEQSRLDTTYLPPYGDNGAAAPYRSSRAATLADGGARLGTFWEGTVGARVGVRASAGFEAEFLGFGQAQLFDYGNGNTRLRDGLGGVGAFFQVELSF